MLERPVVPRHFPQRVSHTENTVASPNTVIAAPTSANNVQDGAPEQLMRQDGVYRALIEREMRLLTRQFA